MTIDEAVNIWMPVVAMGVKDMPEVKEAVRMSITSLKAWQKVIEELHNETNIEVFKPNKECGVYCRMYDVEMLIKKHLQEVEK